MRGLDRREEGEEREEEYLRRTKDFPLEVKMAMRSSRDNVGAAERTATGRAVCSNWRGCMYVCIHVDWSPLARGVDGSARDDAGCAHLGGGHLERACE